jgi:hypothetical protein
MYVLFQVIFLNSTYSYITSVALYFPVLVKTAWFLQNTYILYNRYIHPVNISYVYTYI